MKEHNITGQTQISHLHPARLDMAAYTFSYHMNGGCALEKEVRTVKEKVPVLAAAKAASQVLNQGQLLRGTSVDLAAISELQLLTAKPFLYVFNVPLFFFDFNKY